jgi:hypothetical protein
MTLVPLEVRLRSCLCQPEALIGCGVPQELEAKGKRRRFEIHPDAVQSALAMLDAQPSHSNKKRRFSDIRDVA